MTISKFSILLIILGIFTTGVPVLEFSIIGAEAGLIPADFSLFSEQRGLLFLENNTLISANNPASPEPKVAKKVSVVVTAYSSTVWETDDEPYITAAGTWVREGIIANNLLPFGTKVRLPEIYGDKIFTVEDRMSSKKGYYHFDVWLPSYWQAKEFGAKNTYIEILEG